jgi:hypothetical protein
VFGVALFAGAGAALALGSIAPVLAMPALLLFVPSLFPFVRALSHIRKVIDLEREQRLRYDLKNANGLVQFMNVHPYATAAILTLASSVVALALVVAGWRK